eukprot:1156953-Pelagomonas_calceolata.AAC.5
MGLRECWSAHGNGCSCMCMSVRLGVHVCISASPHSLAAFFTAFFTSSLASTSSTCSTSIAWLYIFGCKHRTHVKPNRFHV